METAFYILLAACLISAFGSIAGVIVIQRISHKERMELLKLIKAQSLTEFTTSDKSQSTKPANFIRSAMKDAYNKGDDEWNKTCAV